MNIVVRHARYTDYLIPDFGRDRWGTTVGHISNAIQFPTPEAARAAARKARRVCMGWNHAKGTPARPYPRIQFRAITI
jgi:hypothetical protein